MNILNNYNKKLGQKYSKEEFFKNLFPREYINSSNSLQNNTVRNIKISRKSFLKKSNKHQLNANVLYSTIESNKILIEINKKIGEGSFSKVYKIKYNGNDKKYIFKLTNKNDNEKSLREYKGLIFHILLQRRLRSMKDSDILLSKICKIYEIGTCNINNTDYYYSIMDNCGEELLEHIKKNKNNYNNLNSIVELMIKMCECIKVIHDVEYMYLDFKPENFLIDDYGNVKLIDFGFILKQNKKLRVLQGTLPYISQRMIKSNKSDTNLEILPDLDLFSIGCFFLEMIYYGILKDYEIYEKKSIIFSSLPYYKAYNIELIKKFRLTLGNLITVDDEIKSHLNNKLSNKLIDKIITIIKICTDPPTENKPQTIDTLIYEFNELRFINNGEYNFNNGSSFKNSKKYFNIYNNRNYEIPILYLLQNSNESKSKNLYFILTHMYNLCKIIFNDELFYFNIIEGKISFYPSLFVINNNKINIVNNVDIIYKNITKTFYYSVPDTLQGITSEQKYIFSLGCFLIGMICIKIYERPTFFRDSMVCPIKINFKGNIGDKRSQYTDEKHRQNLNKINCRLITSGHSVEVSNKVCDIIDRMVNPEPTYSDRYTKINEINVELNELIKLVEPENEQSVTLRNSQRCSVQDGFNKHSEPNSTRSRILSYIRRPFTKELPKYGIYKPKN